MTRPDDQLLPPMKWNAWGDPAAAKPLSDGIRTLARAGPRRRRHARRRARRRRGAPAAVGTVGRRPRGAGRHRRRRRTASPTTTAGCCEPAASPRWTCCAARTPAYRTRPTRCCCPATRTRSPTILRHCAQRGIAVVPFGGGTSVVGGLDPIRGDFTAVVSLDLRRLDATARPRRGLRRGRTRRRASPGPRPRNCLRAHGFSLGHFPQSFQFATIGGFAATRSSGQDSAGYGRFDDMVRGLRVVTPAGVLDLGRAPGIGRRPGPAAADRRLRGRVRRHHPGAGAGASRPGDHPLRGVVLPRLRHRRSRAARRRPDRHRAPPSSGCPTRPRPASTWPPPRASASRPSPADAWRSPSSRAPPHTPRAGTPRPGRCWRRTAARRWATAPARAWEHGRFGAPYLRDSLLAAGALCETLETATNWSQPRHV